MRELFELEEFALILFKALSFETLNNYELLLLPGVVVVVAGAAPKPPILVTQLFPT